MPHGHRKQAQGAKTGLLTICVCVSRLFNVALEQEAEIHPNHLQGTSRQALREAVRRAFVLDDFVGGGPRESNGPYNAVRACTEVAERLGWDSPSLPLPSIAAGGIGSRAPWFYFPTVFGSFALARPIRSSVSGTSYYVVRRAGWAFFSSQLFRALTFYMFVV